MKWVAISQRVDIGKERRDALDQRWSHFLESCGLLPLIIPNHLPLAQSLIASLPISGVLLTGGNDLGVLGGDAPERDAVENFLLDWALEKSIPLMGVCRGMQLIQDFFGQKLVRIEGHVQPSQTIVVNGQKETVNSYHHWGTKEVNQPLTSWAKAQDGTVKAVKHVHKPLQGIMWHPERFETFREIDRTRFSGFFK